MVRLLGAHQTQVRQISSRFLAHHSVKQHPFTQIITLQDFREDFRELGTKKGERPLAVFCKSKLPSLETHKLGSRGGMAGGRQVKVTTNNFNFSSVSTSVSETNLGGCGEVRALRPKFPSLLLTAQTWKSDRSSHTGLHSDVACFLLVPFTIPLAGLHFTWVKIIIKVKEQGREPRNQTQATEMGTVEKEFKAEL